MATSDGLGAFSKKMQSRAGEVSGGSHRMVRAAALVADQAVVLGTPVDTGRARSNWRVTTGAPETGTFPPYASGNNLGPGESQNANAAIAQGSGAIDASRPGQTIYIANNLPYIRRLNEGHSAQAPAGFVEAAVRAAVLAVKTARVFRRT